MKWTFREAREGLLVTYPGRPGCRGLVYISTCPQPLPQVARCGHTFAPRDHFLHMPRDASTGWSVNCDAHPFFNTHACRRANSQEPMHGKRRGKPCNYDVRVHKLGQGHCARATVHSAAVLVCTEYKVCITIHTYTCLVKDK